MSGDFLIVDSGIFLLSSITIAQLLKKNIDPYVKSLLIINLILIIVENILFVNIYKNYKLFLIVNFIDSLIMSFVLSKFLSLRKFGNNKLTIDYYLLISVLYFVINMMSITETFSGPVCYYVYVILFLVGYFVLWSIKPFDELVYKFLTFGLYMFTFFFEDIRQKAMIMKISVLINKCLLYFVLSKEF